MTLGKLSNYMGLIMKKVLKRLREQNQLCNNVCLPTLLNALNAVF